MQFGHVHKILPVGLQNTQRKILRNFVKFYLDVDKIAVAMDKICSSLDKIARQSAKFRENFAARRSSLLGLLSHTRRIYSPHKRRRRFGF
jgi:hypothetical protein